MNKHREVIVRAAGAYTTDLDVPIDANSAKYCDVVIDVTATTTGSITVTIQGLDPASGKKYTILASALIATVSTTVLRVGPALTAAANSIANFALPQRLNININHTDGTSITYSIGMSLME